MRNLLHCGRVAAALTIGLTLVAATTVAAQAAPPNTHTVNKSTASTKLATLASSKQSPASGDHAWTLPPAPHGAESASTAAAVSPTISPAASRVRHVAAGGSASCPSGNLCTAVWDPTTSDWKIFDLYNCNRYYLSYWSGTGPYYNAQTGGVRVYFYDQNSNVLKSFTSTGAGSQDWDPVWSIRNC